MLERARARLSASSTEREGEERCDVRRGKSRVAGDGGRDRPVSRDYGGAASVHVGDALSSNFERITF